MSVLGAPDLLMSMKDIADLAGTLRPAVSNWRRRPIGFPDPASGGETHPLFRPREVADWLVSTERIGREQAEQELSLFMLTGLAATYDGPDVVAAVTALICLRFLAGEYEQLSDGAGAVVTAARARAVECDPDDSVVLTEIRSIPRHAGWLIRSVDDLIEASWNCRDAFERVMAVRHRFGPAAQAAGGGLSSGALSIDMVDPALARLMADLSGAADRARRGDPVVVADPAAGPGDLLAAVARVLGTDNPPLVAAAEADPALARLVRRRLLVHAIRPDDIDVRFGTELPDELGTPDVIVTQVPYQPGEARDAAAVISQIEDVALRLSPGRYGVVLGPASVLAGALPPFHQDERDRARLLADDMVEAVIRLPGGLVPFRPGYETALWVLTQARDSRWKGRVLLADVSDRELTHEVIRDLVEDVVTWRREGYTPSAHRRVFSQQVKVADLVDPPRPLMISRRVAGLRERGEDASRRVALITQCGADLDRIGATATADRRHVSAETLATDDLQPVAETVGALIRTRRLVLRQGTRIRQENIGLSGHHVVLGSDEVSGARRHGQRRVDREVFARAYPNARLTEPGDVLVTTVPRPAVMADARGYAIAEFPVRILRIPAAEKEQFTSRILAALLFADGTHSRATGAVRAGHALEDHRLPLLPPAQVRRLDRLLGEIDARRELTQRELDMLDEMQQAVTGGLINGTLTFTSDPVLSTS